MSPPHFLQGGKQKTLKIKIGVVFHRCLPAFFSRLILYLLLYHFMLSLPCEEIPGPGNY